MPFPVKKPLIIAHRGASRDAPENTAAAFNLAWKQGADAIETDLRLTADGEIVAFHDADGRRIFGDRRLLRTLSFPTLRQLAPPVPTLAEVLALVPSGKQLVLELKEPLVEELAAALADASRDRITIIAFDDAVIASAKRRIPQCRALWLFRDYGSIAGDRGAWLARRVRELGVDGVDLRDERRLDECLLAPLRDDGRTIFMYTANSARSVARGALLGIDGITTDRPGDVRVWLGAAGISA